MVSPGGGGKFAAIEQGGLAAQIRIHHLGLFIVLLKVFIEIRGQIDFDPANPAASCGHGDCAAELFVGAGGPGQAIGEGFPRARIALGLEFLAEDPKPLRGGRRGRRPCPSSRRRQRAR